MLFFPWSCCPLLVSSYHSGLSSFIFPAVRKALSHNFLLGSCLLFQCPNNVFFIIMLHFVTGHFPSDAPCWGKVEKNVKKTWRCALCWPAVWVHQCKLSPRSFLDLFFKPCNVLTVAFSTLRVLSHADGLQMFRNKGGVFSLVWFSWTHEHTKCSDQNWAEITWKRRP